MAIDPARIHRRMVEAEESGRRDLGVREARGVLRVLAVVMDEESQEELHGDVVALVQAS
ncbi:hypothetical protein OG772_20785 [Streptomyces sp. NBC_01321]|uniref:hypothetical protein n=1 Tax=Streptomyces sp. NBC_01321 TaxID=2903825 RepID=UPI002E141EE8|nr:hypothetical protein OG772_20785 [Streptomyces sp. NBC_01321]